jgi:excinuclease UvrABC nuclease subunit
MNLLLTEADVLALPWQKNPAHIWKKAGVYLIREKGTDALLYIGQSIKLSHRLFPATHPVYDREKHDLYVVFTQTEDERNYLESACISILHPALNRRNGRNPSREVISAAADAYYDRIFC